MSWLFSQALVAAYSAENSWDGEPCAPLNVMPTPQPFWRNDKPMDVLSRSPFGLTWKPLTEDRGAALLMWFRAGFPVRTSVQPEKVPASMASDPVCGDRWHALSEKYDLQRSTWKIHRCLFPEDLPWSSVILPKWGLMRNGELWELITLPHLTSGIDVGFWQTPVADDAANREIGKWNGRGEPKLSAQVKLWPTPVADGDRTKNYAQGGTSLGFAVRNWPTPTKSGGTGGAGCSGRNGGLNLRTAVHMWPTPTTCGNHNRKGASKTIGDGLATVVKRMPTPSANDHKGSAKPGQLRGQLTDPAMGVIPAGGQLNPEWVEWLMGWPIGWTDLKPLAMDRFQEWLQQHGGC